MKFSCTIEIEKSKEEVAFQFRNDAHYAACHKDFKSKKLISGKANENGAQTIILFHYGKRPLELTETIIKNNLPNFFSGEYDCTPMCNRMETSFEEIEKDRTRMTANIHYNRFTGFMPNLLKLMGGSMMKKQTQNFLNEFKRFVENQ